MPERKAIIYNPVETKDGPVVEAYGAELVPVDDKTVKITKLEFLLEKSL